MKEEQHKKTQDRQWQQHTFMQALVDVKYNKKKYEDASACWWKNKSQGSGGVCGVML